MNEGSKSDIDRADSIIYETDVAQKYICMNAEDLLKY